MFFQGKIWRKISQQIIKSLNMLPDIQESRIVVAFSGGQDSVFLLAALSGVQKKYHLDLFPLHINHGLIPEDNLYENLARISAKKIDVKCVVAKARVKPKKNNLEDWMRNERYRLLEEYRVKIQADYIAVAHHEDDQAETVLAHAIRGCGIKGLAAMPFQREKIIRPIINVSKSDIEILMSTTTLPYYNDKLNYSLDYQRNKIRHELLPYLKKHFNPQISSCLAKLADTARESSTQAS